MRNNPLITFLQNHKIRPVAAAAKVSTATISRLLDPTPAGKASEWLTPAQMQLWSHRKIKGFVQSVVKLCLHADIEPHEVLACYTLPVSQETIVEWTLSTIEEIKQQAPTQSIVNLRIGLFAWEPHYQSGKKIGDTWIARYSDRLFGAIDPGIRIHYEQVDNLTSGIEAITTPHRNKDTHLDVLGGIFETSDRIFDGMNFVPFPGIHITLGLVFPTRAALDWAHLQCAPLDPHARIHPVVVRADAGSAYVLGACNFNSSNVTLIDEFSVNTIRETLLTLNAGFLAGKTHECHPLVLEMHTARAVLDQLNSQGKADAFSIASNQYAPSYPLGFAVSTHCDRINDWMLKHSQAYDLFQNTPVITAINYLQLLCRDIETGTHAIAIHAPAHASLPLARWKKFLALAVSVDDAILSKQFTQTTIRAAKQCFQDALAHVS